MSAASIGTESQASMLITGALSRPLTSVPAAAPSTRLPGDRVIDAENFFRTSQVADSLRDTAKLLLEAKSEDPTVVAQMARDYEGIRALLGSLVEDTLAEGSERHVPVLGENPTLAMIVYAATQLCRWVDAIQATPSYLISEQVKTANAHEVASKVTQVLSDVAKAAAAVPAPSPKGPGQYL
jgi:hypothetical protein